MLNRYVEVVITNELKNFMNSIRSLMIISTPPLVRKTAPHSHDKIATSKRTAVRCYRAISSEKDVTLTFLIRLPPEAEEGRRCRQNHETDHHLEVSAVLCHFRVVRNSTWH